MNSKEIPNSLPKKSPLLSKNEWNAARKECTNLKEGAQGAEWCVLDGIKGYCGYTGCPRVTGRS